MSRERDIARVALAGSLALGACGPVETDREGQVDATQPRTAEITQIPNFTPEPTSISTEPPTLTKTPTPEPTATPNYEELQRLKPQGVEGEVVMGKEGRPQLKLGLENFNTPGELVIGEYNNGSWILKPFELRVETEDTLADLDKDNRWFPQGGAINEITGMGSVGHRSLIQAIRMDYSEESNSYSLSFVFVHRGKVYKVQPDVVLVHPIGSLSKHEVYEEDQVNVERVGKLLNLLDEEVHNVFTDMFFTTDDVNTDLCGWRTSDIYVNSFEEFCRERAAEDDKEMETVESAHAFFSRHGHSPEYIGRGDSYNWFEEGVIAPLSSEEVFVFMNFSVYEELYEWP